MRKALSTGVSWWRLRPQPSRSSHQSLPMTSTFLEKYLHFTRIHTHSKPSVQDSESTECVLDRSSEPKGCKIEPPSDVKDDSQNAILSFKNAPNNVSANVMSNLKVSKRHDLAMIFTCKVCDKRSMKTCSRESYEKGVVVVRCGGCNNLHLIADRLGWFGEPGSIEDLLAAHGDVVKKGSVDSLDFTLEDLAGKKL